MIQYSGTENIAVLCKGSTADSDSVCLGSNPSTAAKKRQVLTCRFLSIAKAMVYHHAAHVYLITEGAYHQP